MALGESRAKVYGRIVCRRELIGSNITKKNIIVKDRRCVRPCADDIAAFLLEVTSTLYGRIAMQRRDQ